MFGKSFAAKFVGSMRGAGAHVFAVWDYCISCQTPDRAVGSQVELNPEVLAFLIGEPVEKIQKAIDFLCAPDPKSRTEAEGGRRLIKLGAFDYRVVNGAKYRAIRNEEERREQNREAKRRERLKKGKPLNGELEAVAALKAGDERKFDQLSEPKGTQ